ncbi:MAG: cation diffusion facilitator CzcD-associated flavoprotein CzcO [Myxococcota bacterium]|jgi:cation diffusion facilitator CzcD-associated flavoprotein CzcO
MLTGMPSPAPSLGAIIIGAGMSGLCMAIALKRAGISFVILEKSSEIGGTWSANRYPGCACDIPSHLYGYSFAPNPDWSRVWAGQPEILAYLHGVVERFDLAAHIRLDTAARSADYDEAAATWSVATDGETLTARYLISATGPLRIPKLPDIPGIADFAGPSMHSARWREDVVLSGKKVGIVGSAASAVQMVPKLAEQTAHLTIFQRTANYVMPKPNRHYTAAEKWALAHVPGAWKVLRWWQYASHELRFHGIFTPDRLTARVAQAAIRHRIARQIPDPVLRAAVMPDYRIGCKRVLLEGDYYATLSRPDVSVITDSITAIDADGVVTAPGRHDLDVLIYATGFDIWDTDWPSRVRGRGGVSLHDAYGAAPRAWLGMAMPGFPNLFTLLGPNTGLGHNSVVWMAECQVNHIVRLIAAARAAGRTALEVRGPVLDAYNEALHTRMQKRVWVRGQCASWYQHADGRIRSLWPDSTLAWWRTLRRVSLSDYEPE